MKRGIIKDYLCCLELIYTEPKHSCVVIYDENHNIFLDENCIFYTVDNNANIIRHRVKKEKDLGVLDDCNEFYSYYSLYKKIDCYYNIKDAEKEKK